MLPLSSFDPRTGELLAHHQPATPAAAADAVAAAAAAHADRVLAPLATRATLLRACAGALRSRAEEVVAVADAETALGAPRLSGELARTTGQLDAFAELVETGDVTEAIINRARPDAMPPRPDLRRMLVPLGPVVVFGAGNFPLAFGAAGGDVCAALAAGCPLIVKGHPSHPGTGELVAAAVAEAVAQCGLDAGVYAHLLSADLEVCHALVDAPAVSAIAFTGSLRGGSAIARRAASRPAPIPVYAEMGSVNPLVVLDGALAAPGGALLDGLAASLTGSAGQLCTKPGLVLVPASEAGARFVRALVERLHRSGHHLLLDRRLLDGHRETLRAHAACPTTELVACAPDASGGGGYVQPFTVVLSSAAAVARTELLRAEVFGPAAVIATYASEDELFAALGALDGQLTGTVHAGPGDTPLARRSLTVLAERVGRIVFNGFPTGVPVAYATVHGGPWPATNAPTHTSVGLTAARRFLRPLAFQDVPRELLPAELHDENRLGLARREGGPPTPAPVAPDHD